MLTIDGSQYSGSGTIVRQAVAFAALTGRSIHLINARVKREKPGLRPQHIRVVEAIAELASGKVEGLAPGATEFTFRPGPLKTGRRSSWDIGSAGSTTMLVLGLLPVLAFAASPIEVELHGGVFQDFAPSLFHLQHVLLPLLGRMGLHAQVGLERPGYVPQGGGIVRLTVQPLTEGLQPIVLEEVGSVERVWGIALSSHLEERQVSRRMADAARAILAQAGYTAGIDIWYDSTASQKGAALALFADRAGNVRLGADLAGALRRSAEFIGKRVAGQLLQEVQSGATLDRFAADQVIPFAALAPGTSRIVIPEVTDHVRTSAWLAEVFLGATVQVVDGRMKIIGAGFSPSS